MEVIRDHDVGVTLVDLRVEQVAAVGRDGHAIAQVFVGFEDFAGMPGSEIEKANAGWGCLEERSRFRRARASTEIREILSVYRKLPGASHRSGPAQASSYSSWQFSMESKAPCRRKTRS